MKKVVFSMLLSALSFFVFASSSQSATGHQLDFLLGKWSGTGSGRPGQGAGSFVFSRDLDNHILIRRSHSEYPAAQGRPALVHDDLLIVYSDSSKAIYFDNEGHVIHYGVTAASNPTGATFLSTDPSPSPLFRLKYSQVSSDELNVVFEISGTRNPADFKTYLSGSVNRDSEEPR